MKIIDKIVLNRLLSIITSFILGVIKILSPKSIEDLDSPKPKRKILPWRNKNE
jgi:hypothetical protein